VVGPTSVARRFLWVNASTAGVAQVDNGGLLDPSASRKQDRLRDAESPTTTPQRPRDIEALGKYHWIIIAARVQSRERVKQFFKMSAAEVEYL
jgi:hypothetical protein